MAQQVTLTISAEDSASGVLTKVAAGLDTLNKKTKETEESVKKSSEGFKGLGNAAQQLEESIRGLLTPANLFGTVIGGTMLLALKSAISETSAYSQELRSLANITGASTAELAVLNQATNDLGIGTGSLQRGLFLMSREIESGGQSLKRLGLSIRDSSGGMKNETELLYEVSDALSGMSDKTQAANRAREIFGRGAATLLPLLLAGSEHLKELGMDAQKFGLALDDAANKEIKTFDIELHNVEDVLLGVKVTIIRDLIPAILPLVSAFIELIALFQKIPAPLRQTGEVLVFVSAGVIALSVAIKVLKATLLAPWIVEAVTAFATMVFAMNPVTLAIVAVSAALAALVAFDVGGIREKFESLGSSIISGMKAAASAIKETVTTIFSGVQPIFGPPDPTAEEREASFLARRKEIVAEIAKQAMNTEKTVAEMQHELQVETKLATARIDFAKATQSTYDAQITQIREQTALKLAQVDIELKQIKLTEQTAVEYHKIEQEKVLIARAAAAEIAKVHSQEAIAEITRQTEVKKAQITTYEAGAVAIQDQAVLEIKTAKDTYDAKRTQLAKVLPDQKAVNAALIEDVKVRDKTIAIAELNQYKQLRDLHIDYVKEFLTIEQSKITARTEAEKQSTEIALKELDIEGKARQNAFDAGRLSLNELVDVERKAADQRAAIQLVSLAREKSNILEIARDKQAALEAEFGSAGKNDAAKLGQQTVAIAVDTQKQLDAIAAKAQGIKQTWREKDLDLTKQAEAERARILGAAADQQLVLSNETSQKILADEKASVQDQIRARATLFENRKKQYDQDVQEAINAELQKTRIYRDETQKRIAIDAGLINSVKQLRQQYLDNQATMLEQQARQSGDLGKAYEVGFAHAATSADDAFSVMRKAGTDAYASLKSGLSDFLFDVFTGAKTIGDVFTNLGKRILRTMTDTFAEIAVKWAMTAAGFTLPTLLGTATAVAGFEGAPNQAATAVQQLGAVATDASQALAGTAQSGSLLTIAFSAITQTIGMFASGIVAVLQFIGSIASGNAASGLASLFSSTGGGSSLLGQLTSGLSSVFAALSGGVKGVVQGVANLFSSSGGAWSNAAGAMGSGAGTFGSVGLLSKGLAFIGKAAPWIGAAYGLYQMFSGQLSPMSGALQGAAIGTMFGGPIGAGIGAVVGTIAGFISSLFGSTPKANLHATIGPFDRHAFGSAVVDEELASKGKTPGTRVGAAWVDVRGNVISGTKELELQHALADSLNQLLQRVIKATVTMMHGLPSNIASQLDSALTVLEHTTLDAEWSWKGGKAAKKFNKWVKALAGNAIQAIVRELEFGAVDLKALGFDPADPKGKKGGEVARGFDALMAALSGMSILVKQTGDTTATAGVSLAQFTARSIALFKGYQRDGETFTDTIMRVMTATTAASFFLDAYGVTLNNSNITVEEFTRRSVDYFQQFAKEGEKFTDTVQRVASALSGILNVQQQVMQRQQALTNDVVGAMTAQGQAMKKMFDNLGSLADALHIAVESAASPEEVLSAAQALVQAYDAAIQAAQQLKTALTALNQAILDGINLSATLTQKIDSLRGKTLTDAEFTSQYEGVARLVKALTDVDSRTALLADAFVLVSENVSSLTTHIPLLAQHFNTIIAQIRQMSDPQQALGALKNLATAIESGLQAVITAIQHEAQVKIDALNAEKTHIQEVFAARRTALQAEREQLLKQYDTQKAALQTQLQLAQQWASVASSVKSQLTDLFNLIAPTHPLTSMNEVKAQFESAFAAFQAGPTPEGATKVQELAKQLLELAKQTPGYDLPSSAFQGLVSEVQHALDAIQAVTASQPSQEQIQAQIADLEVQQTASLASIDDQLAALDAEQAAQLAAIDQQIAETSAAAQAEIQQFKEVAALGLEKIRVQVMIETERLANEQAQASAKLQDILGDKTYEQFIAEKQTEAAILLRGIDDTLKHYLSEIAKGLGTNIPAMAEGGYVPARQGGTLVRLGEGGYGEMVVPVRAGVSHSQDVHVNFSPQITVNAGSDADGKKIGRAMKAELIEMTKSGEFRSALQAAVRR